ncbi:MAG: hypothetical protein ACREQJ_16675, partial [Candidatus Binatia bacterium]
AILVTVASAQELHKWKTPDGRIFFGDKPPEGSVDLGVVDGANARGRAKLLTDEDVAADEARAVAPEPEGQPTLESSTGKVITDREVAADQAAAVAAAPTPEPTIDPETARRAALASAVRIVAMTATPRKNAWKLAGSVQNAGPETVHAVEVGSVGAWKKTDPKDVPPGEFASFVLEVPADAPIREGSSPPDVEVRWAEQ